MKLKFKKVKAGFGQPAQESKNVADMLREAIEAENDAATQYEQYARITEDEEAKKLFLDIAGDEKQHFGQLTSYLEYIDSNTSKRFEDGKKENESLKVDALTPMLKQVETVVNYGKEPETITEVVDEAETPEELDFHESNITASFSYDDIATDFSKVVEKINSYEAQDELGKQYIEDMKEAQKELEGAFNKWLKLAERLEKNG